jgi:hypothetical protein
MEKSIETNKLKKQRRQWLIQPLGNWIIPCNELRSEWCHWQDPATQNLYHQTNGENQEYQRMWYESYDYDSNEY